ncbi:hypothetical protein CH368_06100 [Leptospira levettii]|nr:hypothetical protein CH368_06100 [Leptospira levettii]
MLTSPTGPVKLNVKRIHESYFEIQENLKYWNHVQLDYEVALTETKLFHFKGNGLRMVDTGLSDYLVDLKSIFINGKDAKDKIVGNNFTSLAFTEPVFGDVTGEAVFFSPIKVAYRTFELDQTSTEKVKFGLSTGEIAFVVPVGIRMGLGDIVILTKSDARQSERILTVPGRKFDFVSHTPVIRIYNLISKTNSGLKEYEEGKDFILLGNDRIYWFSDKPKEYTIMYDYNPVYRVSSKIENGASEDRERVRIYKAKSVSTYNIKG